MVYLFSTCQYGGLKRSLSDTTDFDLYFNLLYKVTLLDILSQISIKFRLFSCVINIGL